MTPCNPSFEDARDAIVLADLVDNEGANLCQIWEAFARRGLGVGAHAGNSDDVSDGVEGFNVPPICAPESGEPEAIRAAAIALAVLSRCRRSTARGLRPQIFQNEWN